MCIYLYTCTPYIANNTHHRIHYICIGTAQYLLPSIPGTCTRVGSYIGRYSDMFYRMCGLTKSRRRGLEPSKRSGQARVSIYIFIFSLVNVLGRCRARPLSTCLTSTITHPPFGAPTDRMRAAAIFRPKGISMRISRVVLPVNLP